MASNTRDNSSAGSQMTADDDWSNISDIASRKRIQNRIAQRTYRNNQKRRIEQLEYHALISRLGQDPMSYDMAWRNLTGAASGIPLLPPGQLLPQPVFAPPNPYGTVAVQAQYPQEHPNLRPGMNKKHRSSSPNRTSSGNSSTPPSGSDQRGTAARAQPTINTNETVFSSVSESSVSPATNMVNHEADHHFYPGSPLDQDFDDDQHWYESTLPSMTSQGSTMLQPKDGDGTSVESHADEKEPGDQQLKHVTWPLHDSLPGNLPTPMSPHTGSQLRDDASIQQRFAYVSQSAKAAGFQSLESMISSYYTSNFQDTPSLANTQRLDRNRRLPRLFADICDNMSTWSSWEAHGCKEELLKVAETIFLTEFDGLAANEELLGFLSGSGSNNAGLSSTHTDKKHREELILKIENIFQSGVPNLWACVNIMTESKNPPSCVAEQNRSHAALAIISLLYCSRTGIDIQSCDLVKSCLNNE